jgi:hypothetical protein
LLLSFLLLDWQLGFTGSQLDDMDELNGFGLVQGGTASPGFTFTLA